MIRCKYKILFGVYLFNQCNKIKDELKKINEIKQNNFSSILKVWNYKLKNLRKRLSNISPYETL